MLRLLWQELKFRRTGIIGWGLGLCFFPLVYLAIYPQVADEMAGLADLEIYQAMGVNLGSFEDWVGSTILLFVPLLASIYALINATGTLAGEDDDGRLEMLVTLPVPRWQLVTVKAIALSIALFFILLVVALVSAGVFVAIEGQIETQATAFDVVRALLTSWPLPFAFAMISLFLGAFSASRRAASLIGAAIIIISYFGSNLAGMVSSLEPLRPFFLFTYLDYTSSALLKGRQVSDVLTLLAVGLVAFALTLFFFQRRNITVGAWPWQRARAGA